MPNLDARPAIKVMTDYHCHPLWNVGSSGPYNIDPHTLPISADLIARLERWADQYDQTLNDDYPPDSGFATPEEHHAFVAEGRQLAYELQQQLGDGYDVFYFDYLTSKVHKVP